MDQSDRRLYEDSIRSLLPKLDPDTLTKVLDQLDHLGFAEDFSLRGHVDERDLEPMKKGHIRILLNNWRAPHPEAGPQTRDVAGPSGAYARSAPEYQDRDKLEARRIEKNECKQKSKVVQIEGKTEIRQLQMTERALNKDTDLRHLSFGHAFPPKETKVVLLVGAKGNGKSTLIDTFANYLLGVELEDDYRFRVTKSETDPGQAHEQTQSITAYTFYHQVTFPDEFPYNLMIVDTPGFGDNRGIEEDKKIERKLKLFFTPDEPGGIGVLHAVGLVVKSSETVLSATLKYLFDSMLAPFGKDIRENIFLLTTFTDGPIPSVLKVAKEDKLPYTEFFKFNNSNLLADCSELRGADKTLCRSIWSMVETSYHAFLNAVTEATPKRLKLTNEVLTERENVETHISTLHGKINITLREAEVLHTNMECFAKHQNEIERTEHFIIDMKKIKKCRIPLKKGEYALNCVKCQLTCHYPCTIDNHLIFRCKRMDTSTRKCTFCPGGCEVKEHEHANEKIAIGDEMIAESAQNMINKYEEACKEKLTCNKVISKILEDVEVIDTEVVTLVDDVRQSLDKLNEIALRPDQSITTAEYIDILIKYEERQDRVEQLSAIRERAMLIKKFAEGNGINEPIKKVKREILQIMADREAGVEGFSEESSIQFQSG